ncbi:hypothetical protein Afil01_19330 [Actinorhabdospora filicis]|uniref:Uncharacterized protein n=1 Tax=Actinorhabdospora filicis TaxID=1785913 RepID=A0A9W6SM58_9ACTN|nr:hypothetical protein [Actinorhabdospora filicis]GLZ77126.1 hypothetical protein Afil01_19330 [Actinorhabdospora filicis]
MTDVDVMGADFPGRLSAEIDRVFARMKVARGMGVLTEIKPRLMAMAGPDPDAFEEAFQAYASLAAMTGAEKSTIAPSDPGFTGVPKGVVTITAEDVAAKVEPWTGTAATAFNAFIKHFRPGGNTIASQRLLFDYLNLAAGAHQQVYINSRRDLWDLVAGLDAGIDTSEDISSPGIAVFLTVVAAIASGGATALAPGLSVAALGATAIAAAGSSGAALISGHAADNREVALDPHDKWTLRDSLVDVIGTMETDLLDAEEKVRLSIQAFTEQMNPGGEIGRQLIGPSVGGGTTPIEWAPDGSGSLPKSYLDDFVPPSETE